MKSFLLFLVLFQQTAFGSNCTKDIKKFCQEVPPGRGQTMKCLEDYSPSLSPACSKELKDFKKTTLLKNPCFNDVGEFCPTVNGDNIKFCLLKNESKLSEICSKDFKAKKPAMFGKEKCSQEIAGLCFTELSGPAGSVNRCLIKNRAKLPLLCQKEVDEKIASFRKKNPCFDDVEKHCPTQVRPHEIHECLEKNVTKLTPVCKTQTQKEIAFAAANPCYLDLMKHCRPGINSSQQKQCLSLNAREVSNSCQQFMTTQKDKSKKRKEACEADRAKFCSGIPLKGGMITKCLKENKAKLSTNCQSYF